MNEAESQMIFQKCVCDSLKTEIRFSKSEHFVVCSKCGRIKSIFQW